MKKQKRIKNPDRTGVSNGLNCLNCVSSLKKLSASFVMIAVAHEVRCLKNKVTQ